MNYLKRRRYFGEMLNEKIRGGNYVLQAELRGNLQFMSLGTLISINCNENRTVRVEINKDGAIGEIFIEEGRIVHARFGSEIGEDAFHKILKLKQGTFTIFPNELPSQNSIEKNWSNLLMESTRRIDEGEAKIDNNGNSEEKTKQDENAEEKIDWNNFQIDFTTDSAEKTIVDEHFKRMIRTMKRLDGVNAITIISHDGNIIYNDDDMAAEKYSLMANAYMDAGQKISELINAQYQKYVFINNHQDFVVVNRGQDLIILLLENNVTPELLLEDVSSVLKRYR
mgnify:CR=1 FL=1